MTQRVALVCTSASDIYHPSYSHLVVPLDTSVLVCILKPPTGPNV